MLLVIVYLYALEGPAEEHDAGHDQQNANQGDVVGVLALAAVGDLRDLEALAPPIVVRVVHVAAVEVALLVLLAQRLVVAVICGWVLLAQALGAHGEGEAGLAAHEHC